MYMAPINVGAHTAAIDFFELLTTTEKPVLVHAFELGQGSEFGDAQEEYIPLALKRVTGAPTSGSGGGTSTFQPLDPNSTATSITLETGNTSKLSGGTSAELGRIAWNVRSGSLFLPPPEGRIPVAGATRLVLEELAAPLDSITGPIGWILAEELV